MNRTKKSVRNIVVAVCTQVIIFCFSLMVRRSFLQTLGVDRLGYESLFANIIGVLSIADLGMFDVMCFFLYKPFAGNNEQLIIAYLRVFRRVFFALGTALFCVSMFVVPFLPNLIQNFQGSVVELQVSFIMFAIMSFSTYYYANYRAVIFVEQNDYALSIINFVIKISIKVLQMIILNYKASFIGYVSSELICTLIGNEIIKKTAINRKPEIFRVIQERKNESDSASVSLPDVKRKVADLFVNRACTTAVAGTDNIILSAFFGAKILGILSNYSIIIAALSTLSNRTFSAFSASYGNFIVTCRNVDEARRKYREFSSATFVLSLSLYLGALLCIDTFLDVFFSSSYLVDKSIVVVMLLSFYLTIVLYLPMTYGNISGKYKNLHSAYIVWAFCNLLASIVLSRVFGYIGVYYGTVIAGAIFYPMIEFRIFAEDLGGRYKEVVIDHIKRCIYLLLISYFVLAVQRSLLFVDGLIQLLVYCLVAIVMVAVVSGTYCMLDQNWKNFVLRMLKLRD